MLPKRWWEVFRALSEEILQICGVNVFARIQELQNDSFVDHYVTLAIHLVWAQYLRALGVHLRPVAGEGNVSELSVSCIQRAMTLQDALSKVDTLDKIEVPLEERTAHQSSLDHRLSIQLGSSSRTSSTKEETSCITLALMNTPGALRHEIESLFAALFAFGHIDRLNDAIDAPKSRIKLPTYPWQKSRHWIDTPRSSDQQKAWTYELDWIPAKATPPLSQGFTTHALVLEGEESLTQKMLASLKTTVDHHTSLSLGTEYAYSPSHHRAVIRPGNQEDIRRLKEALEQDEQTLYTFISAPCAPTHSPLIQVQIAQSIHQLFDPESLASCWFVTHKAQHVQEGDSESLSADSQTWGPCTCAFCREPFTPCLAPRYRRRIDPSGYACVHDTQAIESSISFKTECLKTSPTPPTRTARFSFTHTS